MKYKTIWNFISNFHTKYGDYVSVNGLMTYSYDNYYIVLFNSKFIGTIEFKIEKKYNITNSSTSYSISHISVGTEFMSGKNKLEFLMNELTPFIRDFKLDEIGL